MLAVHRIDVGKAEDPFGECRGEGVEPQGDPMLGQHRRSRSRYRALG